MLLRTLLADNPYCLRQDDPNGLVPLGESVVAISEKRLIAWEMIGLDLGRRTVGTRPSASNFCAFGKPGDIWTAGIRVIYYNWSDDTRAGNGTPQRFRGFGRGYLFEYSGLQIRSAG